MANIDFRELESYALKTFHRIIVKVDEAQINY